MNVYLIKWLCMNNGSRIMVHNNGYANLNNCNTLKFILRVRLEKQPEITSNQSNVKNSFDEDSDTSRNSEKRIEMVVEY